MTTKPGPGHQRGGQRQTYEDDEKIIKLGRRVLKLLEETGPKNNRGLRARLGEPVGSKALDKALQLLRKQERIHYSKASEGGLGAWKLGKRP